MLYFPSEDALRLCFKIKFDVGRAYAERGAAPKKSEDELKALAAEGKEANEISSSQMSFDSQLDNLD